MRLQILVPELSLKVHRGPRWGKKHETLSGVAQQTELHPFCAYLLITHRWKRACSIAPRHRWFCITRSCSTTAATRSFAKPGSSHSKPCQSFIFNFCAWATETCDTICKTTLPPQQHEIVYISFRTSLWTFFDRFENQSVALWRNCQDLKAYDVGVWAPVNINLPLSENNNTITKSESD